MKLKSTLTSQAIRFYNYTGDEPVIERRSPIPLIRGLQDKYGFVEVPLKVIDLDFTKGVTFSRGYYKGHVIDKLALYENGLLCEAMTDNSICDEFVSEVIGWATTEQKIPINETGVKAFLSQLEVTTDLNLSAVFQKINAIGTRLAKALSSYGQPVPSYAVNGIRMHYDSASMPLPRPPEFVFERRAGQPYSSNEFFSSAPLTTKDHMHILVELEKLFH
ncbi:hypothetical protein [Bradyrhizobium elkanii]|uniref:hypothetical protein n=1 Tax=Bradyrhizobium elkanii TaxID=29448 RepID=UPI002226F90C|nr:hypothetical protein [Bradyrhizobium elkanii]MCW2227222.1 hypothetical protein [Bradyrhizobium elkanii]